MVLKRAQLVDHHHVPGPLAAHGAYEPGDVFPVNHRHHRTRRQGVQALLPTSERDRHSETLQVIPLGGFCGPGISGDPQGRDHQNPAGLEGVHQQVPDGTQGDNGFPEPHPEEDRSLRVSHDVVSGLALVVMRRVAHQAPPRSHQGYQGQGR